MINTDLACFLLFLSLPTEEKSLRSSPWVWFQFLENEEVVRREEKTPAL